MYIIDDVCYAGEKNEDIRVSGVRVLRGGMLLLTFVGGEQRLFDISEVPGSAFMPLRDERTLADYRLFHGIVTWMDGEIDMAPEAMYEYSHPYTAPEFADDAI